MDTPGLRELQLWECENGMQTAFDEIEAQASQCRFRDCAHQLEPGCAVREALATGTLDQKRFESYEKLKREMKHLVFKQHGRTERLERQRWKKLSRLAKDRAFAKWKGE